MSATELERLAEAFAAADITEDWIAGVQDEMRGASSMEGQCVVVRTLLNACSGAGFHEVNQFEAFEHLLTGDHALPGGYAKRTTLFPFPLTHTHLSSTT